MWLVIHEVTFSYKVFARIHADTYLRIREEMGVTSNKTAVFH